MHKAYGLTVTSAIAMVTRSTKTDHSKETAECQGTAGQVALLNRVIRVGLWKCQIWTKQEGVKITGGRIPAGGKALSWDLTCHV